MHGLFSLDNRAQNEEAPTISILLVRNIKGRRFGIGFMVSWLKHTFVGTSFTYMWFYSVTARYIKPYIPVLNAEISELTSFPCSLFFRAYQYTVSYHVNTEENWTMLCLLSWDISCFCRHIRLFLLGAKAQILPCLIFFFMISDKLMDYTLLCEVEKIPTSWTHKDLLKPMGLFDVTHRLMSGLWIRTHMCDFLSDSYPSYNQAKSPNCFF